MKFGKYCLVFLGVAISVFFGDFSVKAQKNMLLDINIENPNIMGQENLSEETVSPCADTIVYKYRMVEGVLQYRRWNETQGCWVDADWINAT